MSGSADTRPTIAWRHGLRSEQSRSVPDERAVALTYDGTTYAVMMATPDDLEDFGIGFSLTEGLVADRSEIEGLTVVETEEGIELRMQLAQPAATALAARRRRLAGPVGCGLCGIESLQQAVRSLPVLPDDMVLAPNVIEEAVRALPRHQVMNRLTHAVHGAAFCEASGAIVVVREDIGRHNALDKTAGAALRAGVDLTGGFLLVTSRLSVELVQKAAILGVPALVGISAPTAFAIQAAEGANMILVGVARDDGFEVFAGAERVTNPNSANMGPDVAPGIAVK